MNKIKFLITTLLLTFVILYSCKKDDELTKTNDVKVESYSHNGTEMKNLDEYLLNFMKEIKSATRDTEPMTTEDALWHLSACLNFRFCNANVARTHIYYDTIVTSINIENDYISLNEINRSLAEISAEVSSIYDSYNHNNKNLYYINPVIENNSTRNGTTVKTIVATSGNDGSGNYYFNGNIMYATRKNFSISSMIITTMNGIQKQLTV